MVVFVYSCFRREQAEISLPLKDKRNYHICELKLQLQIMAKFIADINLEVINVDKTRVILYYNEILEYISFK